MRGLFVGLLAFPISVVAMASWTPERTIALDSASAFAMSTDGRVAAVAGFSSLMLIDTTHWAVTRTLQLASSPVAVALSPEGRTVAAGLYNNTTCVWDTSSGREITTLIGRPNSLTGLAFSRDGRYLASAMTSATVQLWDTATWKALPLLSGLPMAGTSLAFSPDSLKLAATAVAATWNTWSEYVVIWSMETGKQLSLFQRPGPGAYASCFSPDGRLLCAGYGVWDTRSGRVTSSLGLPASSNWVDFSPDGTLLATAGTDGVIRLWMAATGYFVRDLVGHTDSAVFVQFSPDGKSIVSGGLDRTLRVWKVK